MQFSDCTENTAMFNNLNLFVLKNYTFLWVHLMFQYLKNTTYVVDLDSKKSCWQKLLRFHSKLNT